MTDSQRIRALTAEARRIRALATRPKGPAVTRYWKAIIAALPVLIFVGQEVAQALDEAGDTLTQSEIIRILIAALAAVGVYAKANTPGRGQARDPHISETAR